MKDIDKDFWQVFYESLKNYSLDRCSRWAPERRVVEGGKPFSLTRYPYIRDILDSRAKKNWILKGAQVGLSTGAYTIGMFEIDYHQRDVIYYFPTNVMAERFSKGRFSQEIKLSPYLKSAVHNDSKDIKQIGNASMYVMGANSDTNLKGTSTGRLILDELDEWTDRQIYLAEQRMRGQEDDDKICWAFSTPIYPNRGIDKHFKKSTQEHYFFDCPHCSEKIELLWEDSFEICGESIDDPKLMESHLKCSKCGGKLEHKEKAEWLKHVEDGGSGHWEATNPEADPNLSRGFWISQLYSPTVEPYEIAQDYLRGRGDEDARREFHNSVLGLPYVEDAHQLNDVHIDNAIKRYSLRDVQPTAASDGIFTLGIDQGGELHHWVAIKWMFHRDRVGDPNDRAIGRLVGLGRIMHDDWASVHGLMAGYQARMCVIDYFPEPTQARVFARAFEGGVYLCQYVTGSSGREIRTTEEDDYGTNLVKVDKAGWMSKSLGRIMSGDIELPLDLPGEFRRQVKSPIRTIQNVKGIPKAFYVDSTDDHFANALSYAEIALKILDPALHASSIIKET